MREIRIRVPDLKDGQRLLASARERASRLSSHATDKAQELSEQVRERVQDLEAPRIHLVDARRLARGTNERLEEASTLLQAEHDEAAAQMQRLGESELAAYDGPIRDFVGLFERMKNVELTDLELEGVPEFVRSFDVDVRDVDFSAVDALKTMAAGGGAGAAAGLTALAAVGTFASASTGTAISALGGAAATNATLAWLGGGAVAAGGGGMAAGAVVLGGIVALPVLAIGGLVIHHKGRQALAEAKEDAAKAEIVIQEMENARTMARGIRLRAKRITSLVDQLAELGRQRNEVLRHLVGRNDDYATYDEHDRRAVMLAASIAKTLRTVMDVPVIDEGGTLTSESREAIEAAEQLLADPNQTTA